MSAAVDYAALEERARAAEARLRAAEARAEAAEERARSAEAEAKGAKQRLFGVSELLQKFVDYSTQGHISPGDLFTTLVLYSKCQWGLGDAPPAEASTPAVSYAYAGQWVGLKREGMKAAAGRLRERGWLTTTLHAATGYLTYTLKFGKIMSDLEKWGLFRVRDVKLSRPPSRRGDQRGERWKERPRPALPESPRGRPQSPEASRLVRLWRRLFRRAPDPTPTIFNLVHRDGRSEALLRRVITQMEREGLYAPQPEFLRDRVARLVESRGSEVDEEPGATAHDPTGQLPTDEPAEAADDLGAEPAPAPANEPSPERESPTTPSRTSPGWVAPPAARPTALTSDELAAGRRLFERFMRTRSPGKVAPPAKRSDTWTENGPSPAGPGTGQQGEGP